MPLDFDNPREEPTLGLCVGVSHPTKQRRIKIGAETKRRMEEARRREKAKKEASYPAKKNSSVASKYIWNDDLVYEASPALQEEFIKRARRSIR